MSLRILISVFLMAGFFIMGCSDDDDPTGPGGGDISITVGEGLTPQYSWTEGDVFSLSVVRTSDPDSIIWGIATPGVDGISSPVIHGIIPEGVTVVSETEIILEDGIEYRVSVTRLDGTSGYYEFTAEAVEIPGTVVELDATSHDSYVYYNFTTEQTVDISDADAESSSDWHIAFRRNLGKLNSGISGPAALKAVDLEELGSPFGTNFSAVTDLPEIGEDDWQIDEKRMVFDGWYNYDTETHIVSPTNRLYAFRTANGNYAKVVVVDTIVVLGRGLLGGVGLKYVYNGNGSTDLSGEAMTVQLNDDDQNNSFFFSFETGGLVEIADPMSSTEWDIWFDGFDVKINGGIHGPGECGIYPIWEENNDFDALVSAPMDMGGSYETDAISSIFDNWYNYDGENHELTSKGHVYIIMVDESTYIKMIIENYYKVIQGSPVSAWITFRFDTL